MSINFNNMGAEPAVKLDLSKNTDNVKLDLTKSNGRPLRNVYFGASWDPVVAGTPIDIDTSAVGLHSADNKWHTLDDVLYFNNKHTPYMEHSDDALTGAEVSGEGDDEYLIVHLENVPNDINEIVLIATVYDAEKREQTFGMVRSEVHIKDKDSGEPLAKIYLSDDYATDYSVILGTITRGANGVWSFITSGQGAMIEIGTVLASYQAR